MSARPAALVLAGPTASGKSALALALAARVPLEIVSVDSALVYRGMDIGTAKPSPAELAAVPHHLIDLIEPTEAYSAARFVADARRLIGQINARGRVALLVGGTMLYVKALREGLDAMPPADAALRAALDARAATEGWPALHAELARVDPATAARLPPHDAQRIQRALEVWQLTGRPISDWQRRDQLDADRADARAGPQAADGGIRSSGSRKVTTGHASGTHDSDDDSSGSETGHVAGTGALPGLDLPLWSLEPAERGWLHRRIAERFDAMLAAGLVDEVRRLRARGDLQPTLPSMRCVGYRQVWAALDAVADAPLQGPATQALRETGIAATRQLAKRQLTWLRGMPRQVLRCDAPGATDAALQALLPALHALQAQLPPVPGDAAASPPPPPRPLDAPPRPPR